MIKILVKTRGYDEIYALLKDLRELKCNKSLYLEHVTKIVVILIRTIASTYYTLVRSV